jgi:transposase
MADWDTCAGSFSAIPTPYGRGEKMSGSSQRTRPPDASEKKGGRKKASIAIPELVDNFVEILVHHTGGDPNEEDLVWTYLTQQQIADELAEFGTPVSTETVRELLHEFGMSKRKAQKSVT